MDCTLPGSSVRGILQARILEWVAISSSKGSSRPRDQARSPALASGFSATEALGKPLDHRTKDIAEVRVLVTQLCLTLCNPIDFNPMDCSPPGSSVHGILQAKTLEWVLIPVSRESSPPKDRTPVSCTAGRFFTVWASREANGQYIII